MESGRIESPLSSTASRLKFLLERDEERQRRKAIQTLSERNRYSGYEFPNPTDMIPLIANQSSVEHQLQEQVNFYQDALKTLKERSEQIANENAMLYERMRQSIEEEQTLVLDHNTGASESEYEDDDADSYRTCAVRDAVAGTLKQPKERLLRTKAECDTEKKRLAVKHSVSDVSNQEQQMNDSEEISQENIKEVKHHMTSLNKSTRTAEVQTDSMSFPSNFMEGHMLLSEEMDKMQKIYETKTKHLKSLLNTTRKQAEEQQDEIMKLKRSLGEQKKKEECAKCYGSTSGEQRILKRLSREKEELIESIKKQQKLVEEGNRREIEAYHQVKKSCELVEQAQLEKQEALVMVKQLKKDLQSQTSKYEKIQEKYDGHNRMFNHQLKDEMQNKIDGLDKKVDHQANLISVLQVQVEKLTREKVDLKKEAEQLKNHIIAQKSETTGIVEESRREVLDALKAKTLAEQEINQQHIDFQRREKRKQQAMDQLAVEVDETKRRLQITEGNLQRSQDELLDLSKKYNACSQQLQQEKLQQKMYKHGLEDEKKRLQHEASQKEQELTLLLQESDARCNTTRDELTRLLESQTAIVNKYQSEYQTLNEGIMAEREQNKEMFTKLKSKCQVLEMKVSESTDILTKKDIDIQKYQQQLEYYEVELKDHKEQVLMLMNKQNTILRDRQILTKEIDLLTNQLKRISNS